MRSKLLDNKITLKIQPRILRENDKRIVGKSISSQLIKIIRMELLKSSSPHHNIQLEMFANWRRLKIMNYNHDIF